MSASWQRILGLMITSFWLFVGCSGAKKIDVGGTCILNSDCNQGLVCTWGICHVACHTSADCQPGQSCIIASAQSTVCESPTSCIYNSDCQTGLICAVDQQCRKQCQTDGDCTSGQTCTSTQTCAELSQVDSNNNLLVPDGGVSGSGGASGAGDSGGSISPNPDGPPDLPADLSGSSGGGGVTGTATGGTIVTGGTAVVGGTKATGGAPPTAGTTASGGSKQSGGTTPTGGSAPKGGTTTTTSGTMPTGGVTTTSGGARPYAGVPSTPVNGVPVLRSSFTSIASVVGTPGMRLGDINGDGKMEIVMGQPMPQPGAYTPQQVVCVTAYDLKGKQLWQYGTPGTSHGASSDIPIQVYDMDGDGKSEVFANMSDSEMTVLDGTTGKLVRTIPLPQAGSNDSIAFANLRGKGWPQDILVKTRYSQNWAIVGIDDTTTTPPTKAGTVLWHHAFLPSDSSGSDRGTGHYPLV